MMSYNKSNTYKGKKYLYFDECELIDKDFYPPEDNRIYTIGILDIDGGDNFDDYIEWFYDMYGDDLFDD